MLGIIAIAAIIILVLLFKYAIAGSAVYQDKIRLVPQLEMPATPGIQPDVPTIDERFQKRRIYWIESNEAYVIPGELISEGVYQEKYPIVYETPAWVEYPIVEQK